MFIIENITDIFLPIWTLWVRCGYVLWANLSLAFLARFELWAKALWANLSLVFLARFELWAKALWANLSLVFLERFELWARALWANFSLVFLARFELWAKALWANLFLVFFAHFELWARALWANVSLAFLARFELWAKALWANLSLSRARSELRDWLTRPLLGSPRRGSVATLYATLVVVCLRVPTVLVPNRSHLPPTIVGGTSVGKLSVRPAVARYRALSGFWECRGCSLLFIVPCICMATK